MSCGHILQILLDFSVHSLLRPLDRWLLFGMGFFPRLLLQTQEGASFRHGLLSEIKPTGLVVEVLLGAVVFTLVHFKNDMCTFILYIYIYIYQFLSFHQENMRGQERDTEGVGCD